MTLIVLVLVVALAFEYINGFHDTANAIATIVSTKVLSPRQAVVLAAACDLVGALTSVSVATTVGKGLVDIGAVTTITVLAALIAAVLWNLLTWWLGLPSSSSHALIGGLCGAALASAGGNWHVIRWSVPVPGGGHEGLWDKVIVPMVTAPTLGIVLGFAVMTLLILLLHRLTPRFINAVFGKLQLLSGAWMGVSHGMNDAQKTMGVIALVLFTATTSGTFEHLPPSLHFLRTPTFEVATWVKIACALTLSMGTATGGWRIIKTLGQRVVRLQPIHGFAVQTTAAAIIQAASHFGIPLSTTHVVSASIMGVGATKRLSAVKWGIVHRILWAWVLTLPVTALVGYWAERLIMYGRR